MNPQNLQLIGFFWIYCILKDQHCFDMFRHADFVFSKCVPARRWIGFFSVMNLCFDDVNYYNTSFDNDKSNSVKKRHQFQEEFYDLSIPRRWLVSYCENSIYSACFGVQFRSYISFLDRNPSTKKVQSYFLFSKILFYSKIHCSLEFLITRVCTFSGCRITHSKNLRFSFFLLHLLSDDFSLFLRISIVSAQPQTPQFRAKGLNWLIALISIHCPHFD